ncbi:MAG: transcriptional repressor [Deltaproteobacteria bacterium]|nr:transcriptional repressor [Nannocystaceae bacterium]
MDPTSDMLPARLRDAGILPSVQRVAVARYVLATHDHPSADEVLLQVRRELPAISRATVYNTLNLLVERGLLRAHVLAPRRVVFDPNLDRHHHFIDERSGRIHDVPWSSVQVPELPELPGFEVHEYQLVMRGRAAGRAAAERRRGTRR